MDINVLTKQELSMISEALLMTPLGQLFVKISAAQKRIAAEEAKSAGGDATPPAGDKT